MSAELLTQLQDLLGEFTIIFTWTAEDMRGFPSTLAEHKLNVDPHAKPVKQKREALLPKKNWLIVEDVGKLLTVKFIMEVLYLVWLANLVVVPKSNIS